ncbi:hypothetical protein ScPMuIL_014983 [Solemya velum]
MFESHNYHLTPTQREIEMWLPGLAENERVEFQFQAGKITYPEEIDDFFFHELLFINNEQKIADHFENEQKIHDAKVAEARLLNTLHECTCCYDDECLFEDMCSCPDGHLFCNGCVRKLAESIIEQGKTKFPCLTGTCVHDFNLTLLQEILSPSAFSVALQKMQEEELRLASIPDLESCPFCSFATIMSNPEDKVFKCLNPDCLKESCRLCKEPNHIPLRCNEVETQDETKMRAYIELKMTEAMFRKCPDCGKRFFKEDGCSSVICPCGANICYICGKKFKNNDHRRCTDIASQKAHQKEMKAAAETAKNQYLQEHPEMWNTVLKYDPQNT